MDAVTKEIYESKTGPAMFNIRLKDGPRFQKYRVALAEMMKNPTTAKVIETKTALEGLIAVNPKSLSSLSKMISDAAGNEKKLAFVLTKVYDLTLGSRASHTIGEHAKDEKNLDKAGKEYDVYAKKLAKDFAKVWSENGIKIDEKGMAELMKREAGEKLTPGTLSSANIDKNGIV